jgi:putative SOS response-associated peptidase YedK
MCYSLSFLEQKAERYIKRYEAILPEYVSTPQLEFKTYGLVSGFDHPPLPLVTPSDLLVAQWGLIPSWAASADIATMQNMTLNAVSESIFEKASFKEPIKKQRAILGTAGFYEWCHLGKTKYPFLVKSEDEYLSLACIYETKGQTASFSIVTEEAKGIMAKIHNTKKRQPLMLTPDAEKAWLSDTFDTQHQLDDWLKTHHRPELKPEMMAVNKGQATKWHYPELQFEFPELF